MQATEADYETAEKYFEEADQNVKLAIVMILTNSDKEEAQAKLAEANGFVKGPYEGKDHGKNELTLEELAKQIYKGAGGMGNVESIVHCMTRVRMKIINDDLVNVSELKAIPGVLGVVEDEQLQVIIGPGKVNKVAQQMVDLAGVKLGKTFFCKYSYSKFISI